MNRKPNRFVSILSAVLTALVIVFPLIPEASAQSGDRILTISIRTGEEDGSIPLANMVVDLYKVATMKQLREGAFTLEDKPSPEEISLYKKRANLVGTVMTNEQGLAGFDFTRAGLPDGVYLAVLQDNPAVTGTEQSVFLTMSGSKEIALEAIAEKAPDIQMDVESLQQKSASFDIGQAHTWIIRSDIPAGICNAREYRVTDVLDHRLDYEKGSLTAVVQKADGASLPLEPGVHYRLTEEIITGNGNPAHRFRLELTAEGMAQAAVFSGDGQPCQLRLRFRAAMNRKAGLGTTIPNDAHLDYINSAGVAYHADSDIPEVHTGGLHILKTDSESRPLAGCEFMIAREASQQELENEAIPKEILHFGNQNLAVVYRGFYRDYGEESKVFRVSTDEEGKAAIYGLSYGKYYLVESAAPEGYDNLTRPIMVEIHETSHWTREDGKQDSDGQWIDNTIRVVNTKFRFPNTGGDSFDGFTIVGSLLICAACLLMFSNRNKRI